MPLLHVITEAEHAAAVDKFERLVDDRLAELAWSHEQRWAGLPESVQDWFREILNAVLKDVRADVLALLRGLPPVH